MTRDCTTCGGSGYVGTLTATYACEDCTPGFDAPSRRIPVPASPLAHFLGSWAYGAEPELRCGDVVLLHEGIRALLRDLGVPEGHVREVCGDSQDPRAEGAAGGASDAGTKERRGHEFGDQTASQS